MNETKEETMDDHKAEAQRITQEVSEGVQSVLELGNNIPFPQLENFNRNVSRELARAQVHATLYLAEQQRVANLIAYVREIDDGSDTYLLIGPMIKEALGLT